ncbi:MAG: ATP-binding protein [Pseudomonadota bacterium]|nr:ATP-binding protein [Pseudomonadota bacterium]
MSAALADTPVVLLNGARQTGKSTLAREYAKALSATYVTLDDATQLAAARSDVRGFLSGLGDRVVIDEVQKAPEMFPAIKMSVDRDRRPGRFLLTGSANVLLLPRISESLAGRMELITLWPLSQGELHAKRETFLEAAFARRLPVFQADDEFNLTSAVQAGAYPEAVQRSPGKRRDAWFSSYISALLQRDVRDLSNIDGLTEMPRLLSLLAARVGGLLNMSELSRSSGIAHTTLKRYLSLLQATFLFQPLTAWSSNIGKRLIKSSKIHLIDSGLVAHLAGFSDCGTQSGRIFFGHLLETFVVSELRKQAGWSDLRVNLFHYRTTGGREIDILLEDASGRLVGLEVQASATVTRKDFSGIDALAESVGDRLLRGIVLYTGRQAASFGKRHAALPISALWRMTD